MDDLIARVCTCQKEYRELKEKYEDALKTIEKYRVEHNKNSGTKISLDSKSLIGKTIQNVSRFSAEFGRSYGMYLGIICTDGTRVMLNGGEIYAPNPNLIDMIDSAFFTDDEIRIKKERVEQDKKEREYIEIQRKKDELERLQKELKGK